MFGVRLQSSAHRSGDEDSDATEGKNPFLTIGNDKSRRRSSQFDRALHRIYSTPRPIFGVKVVDQLIARVYWSIRSVQFRLFYKNEGLFSPAKPCPLPRTGLSN
ncbi:hypothetical protein QR680_006872 [Steinernema hermaphroditum]|uniref:Uncharacterized protein n=1 Tax=Steinernema hermaphroditum TaxID=289476 RepID=A0AA39LX76_9BILA|nr:hypothetical protein QR680_006872 [Steinernema hermaphroditum]